MPLTVTTPRASTADTTPLGRDVGHAMLFPGQQTRRGALGRRRGAPHGKAATDPRAANGSSTNELRRSHLAAAQLADGCMRPRRRARELGRVDKRVGSRAPILSDCELLLVRLHDLHDGVDASVSGKSRMAAQRLAHGAG